MLTKRLLYQMWNINPKRTKLQELIDNVLPLSESDEQGIDLYVKTKMFLQS